MFYALYEALFVRRDVAHFMHAPRAPLLPPPDVGPRRRYLEPDAVPLRSRWLESLYGLVPPRAPRFWIKGSAARGPADLGEWARRAGARLEFE